MEENSTKKGGREGIKEEGRKEREEGGVSLCCYLTSPPLALLGASAVGTAPSCVSCGSHCAVGEVRTGGGVQREG